MLETQIILENHPDALQSAVKALNDGDLIAFPTDTVYGVAAPAFSAAGIERLYQVKVRDPNKPIALLIGNLSQLAQVASELSPTARRLAEQFWPGALTLVVHRHSSLPPILSLQPTIGVRMPAYPFTLNLLCQTGPLATTSANLSGAANPLTAQDVMEQLGGKIKLIIDGGRTLASVPSTVVDCTLPRPVILRLGAITVEMLVPYFDL